MIKKLLSILFLIGVGLLLLLYFYFNYQFWNHVKTGDFKTLIEYRGKNIKGFRGRQILIHENFEPYIIRVDNYAVNCNVRLIVNQGYRNDKQRLNRTVVKPVKSSNHLAGYAIDFNVKYKGLKYFADELNRDNLSNLPKEIQIFIDFIREDKDLRWGGDFKRQDPVHIDYPINSKNIAAWKKSSKLCAKDYSSSVPKWKVWK